MGKIISESFQWWGKRDEDHGTRMRSKSAPRYLYKYEQRPISEIRSCLAYTGNFGYSAEGTME